LGHVAELLGSSSRPTLARITLRSVVIGSAPEWRQREGTHPFLWPVARTIHAKLSDQVLASTTKDARSCDLPTSFQSAHSKAEPY
jgi:hypothetical protein